MQLVISGYNAAITLIDSPDFLELHLQTSKELCVQVKNAVCAGLAAVVKKLNYTDIRFETAFFCNCGIVSYQHAATHNETHWKCSVAPMNRGLEENQRVWLGSAVLGMLNLAFIAVFLTSRRCPVYLYKKVTVITILLFNFVHGLVVLLTDYK